MTAAKKISLDALLTAVRRANESYHLKYGWGIGDGGPARGMMKPVAQLSIELRRVLAGLEKIEQGADASALRTVLIAGFNLKSKRPLPYPAMVDRFDQFAEDLKVFSSACEVLGSNTKSKIRVDFQCYVGELATELESIAGKVATFAQLMKALEAAAENNVALHPQVKDLLLFEGQIKAILRSRARGSIWSDKQ